MSDLFGLGYASESGNHPEDRRGYISPRTSLEIERDYDTREQIKDEAIEKNIKE